MAVRLFGRNSLLRRSSCEVFAPSGINVRHRKSIDLRNPQPRQLEFRIMQELCKPILPPRPVNPAADCVVGASRKMRETHDLIEYDEFRLTQVARIFQDYRMIVLLQRLSMTSYEAWQLKVRLYRKNMALKVYPNFLYRKFIERNPYYTELMPLFHGDNYIAAGDVHQVADLVKLMKKDPYCTILGGIVGDKIYNRAGIMRLADLPNISTLHGQLSSILSQSASRTQQLLQSHQRHLVQNLQQLENQGGSEKS